MTEYDELYQLTVAAGLREALKDVPMEELGSCWFTHRWSSWVITDMHGDGGMALQARRCRRCGETQVRRCG